MASVTDRSLNGQNGTGHHPNPTFSTCSIKVLYTYVGTSCADAALHNKALSAVFHASLVDKSNLAITFEHSSNPNNNNKSNNTNQKSLTDCQSVLQQHILD